MCLKLQPQNVVVQFALKKFGEGIAIDTSFNTRKRLTVEMTWGETDIHTSLDLSSRTKLC